MKSKYELGWLVGIIEGEGSFTVSKRGHGRLTIGTTDEDVARHALTLVPAARIYGPYQKSNPKWKPMWFVILTRWEELSALIERVLPLLSGRRQEQAQAILDSPHPNTPRQRDVAGRYN